MKLNQRQLEAISFDPKKGFIGCHVPYPVWNLDMNTMTGELLDQRDVKELLKTGVLVWQTNQGILRGEVPISPKSGRKISGRVQISKETFQDNMEELWEIFRKSEIGGGRYAFSPVDKDTWVILMEACIDIGYWETCPLGKELKKIPYKKMENTQ